MKFSLRRLVVTIIFVLLIGAVSIASVFLATFDLNDFRVEISESIGSRLSQPVHLGRAHLSIKHGPSFAFDNVRVGTRTSPFLLKSEHVFFRLEVLPLLQGEFRFSEILFEKPDLTVEIKSSPGSGETSRLVLDQSLVTGELVKSLRIRDGNFRIRDYRRSQDPFLLAFENTDMVIDDLSLRQSGWIEVKTEVNCNGVRSPLHLKGEIKADESSPFWSHARYDLELDIRDLATDLLTRHYGNILANFLIHGRSDITARVSGTPANGLDFDTRLSGRDLGLILPGRQTPIPAGQITVKGIWQNESGVHSFTQVDMQFDGMKAAGRFKVDLTDPEPNLTAKLEAPRLALTDLNRFLPPADETRPGTRPVFSAGTLQVKRLEISGPVSSFTGLEATETIKHLDFSINSGRLNLGKSFDLEDCSFDVEWTKDRIRVESAVFRTKELHFEAQGAFELLYNATPEGLHLAGKTELQTTPLNRSERTDRALLPDNGLTASLRLDAFYRDGSWTLNDSQFALAETRALLRGQWIVGESLALDFGIPGLSLEELAQIAPVVGVVEPAGKVSAEIHYRHLPEEDDRLFGDISLENVRLKVPGPVDSLNALSGVLDFDWPRLAGTNLSADLGNSPIHLDLNVPALTEPRVEMTIRGDSIRGDELIFRSEKHYLRDVNARLTFERRTLLLGPIHTRMEGGTDVTIHGRIENLPTADTYLTISGRYGNIDEVIGLWIPERPNNRKNKKKREPGHLEIDIATDAGEIANMPFEDGSAHISYRDRTLIIHPLRFRSGAGVGLGQVLIVYRDDRPPLMKISGHLEDFDARAVYQQLLQRKGIVTGRLRGDFYLQGTAGSLKETFLPSSFGAFNFEVRDGVLKKMRGLSEALTVFNIYPIFTSSGRERGVPFEHLAGNALLEDGVLKSEDLRMTGDVMNITMSGSQNLISSQLDLDLGIMPLRTVDRVVTKIPLAGWILAGKDKALVTAHFKIRGPAEDPEIKPVPIESASKQVLGIFERVLTLPVKIITDMDEVLNK